ncbi:MAG: hypothetical protein FWF46_09425 [Oscillospiraceae bacterium]|nr:hypothetical protein [Oscillospiraceae bacterium]
MKKIKGESGITLLSVVFTFIILIIVGSIVIPKIAEIGSTQDMDNLKQDLELLQDKVNMYYQEKGTLPIVGVRIATIPSALTDNKNQNDGDDYYKIDTSLLGDIKLNLGSGSSDDYYIVNEQSHQVYYLRGIVSNNGQTIYAINTDSTNITGVSNNYKPISFGFTTQASDTNITVTVDTVNNIAGYSYKLDNGDWTALTMDTTYTFSNVSYAKHTISVRIQDMNGNLIYSKDNPSEITVI